MSDPFDSEPMSERTGERILQALERIEVLLARRMPRQRTAKRVAGNVVTTSAVPMAQILKAWGEICPDLDQPTMLTDQRRASLRWLWDKYKSSRHGPMECICGFFEIVAASDFLCGRNGHAWKADLFWCLDPDHFAHIIEGRYSNEAMKRTGSR